MPASPAGTVASRGQGGDSDTGQCVGVGDQAPHRRHAGGQRDKCDEDDTSANADLIERFFSGDPDYGQSIYAKSGWVVMVAS